MRLSSPNTPRDIPLGDLVLTVIPAGQFLRDLAQNSGRRRAREMIENAELWADYGLENTALSEIFSAPSGDEEGGYALTGDDEVLVGYGTHVYAVELALLTIKGWRTAKEGGRFEDEQGNPADVNRRNISLLFLEPLPGEVTTYASGFVREVHQLSSLELTEGKP